MKEHEHTTKDEAELLRAIADTLDCPIPPFVEIAGPENMTGAML